MNAALDTRLTHLEPRPVLVSDRRTTIRVPGNDPFFQGWGPKL